MSAPISDPATLTGANIKDTSEGYVAPAIDVRKLNHSFGEGEERKQQVLFDVNLEIMPGEIVIMTGPSGSGKTTLLTLIGALRTLQEGDIHVLGQDLKGLSVEDAVRVRRGIGFIFQAHNLFQSLTAYQNVRMGLELHSWDAPRMDDRITGLLGKLHMPDRIHYRPDELSGGLKQRVAIARALAPRPKLILADEPTAALDKDNGRVVVNLLQQMAEEERVTSVIVTHDNRILDVADRIVNMEQGRIKKNTLVKELPRLCEFLHQCETFSDFSLQKLTDMAEKMVKERYPPGAVIVRQGDPGEKFFVIQKGTVDVIIDQGKPTEHRPAISVLMEGDVFGEKALMTGEPRSATIVARELVNCYTLGKDAFQAALASNPSFHEQIRQYLLSRR